jgi:hypothetical protein
VSGISTSQWRDETAEHLWKKCRLHARETGQGSVATRGSIRASMMGLECIESRYFDHALSLRAHISAFFRSDY